MCTHGRASTTPAPATPVPSTVDSSDWTVPLPYPWHDFDRALRNRRSRWVFFGDWGMTPMLKWCAYVASSKYGEVSFSDFHGSDPESRCASFRSLRERARAETRAQSGRDVSMARAQHHDPGLESQGFCPMRTFPRRSSTVPRWPLDASYERSDDEVIHPHRQWSIGPPDTLKQPFCFSRLDNEQQPWRISTGAMVSEVSGCLTMAQSGRDFQVSDTATEPADRRAKRDAIQRIVARHKLKAEIAATISKLERELRIKAQRDKRSGVAAESGRLLPVIGAASIGLLTGAVRRVLRKAEKACESVTAAVDKASGSCGKLADGLLDKAGRTCDTASDVMATTHSSISEMASGLVAKLNGLKTHMSHPVFLAIVVPLLAFYILRVVKEGSFCQLVLVAALTSLCGPPLWDSIAKFFRFGSGSPSEPTLVSRQTFDGPAGDTDDEESGPPVTIMSGRAVYAQSTSSVFSAVVASCMCFSVFGAGFTSRTVSESMKRVSMLERTATGFEAFTNWLIAAIESIMTFFSRRFGGPVVRLRKETDVEFKRWAREVEALEKVWNLNERDIDAAECDKLMALCARGAELKELYRSRPQVYSAVTSMIIRLHALFAPYQGSISARNNFRVEPELLMFCGEPGIGKTLLMMPMCAYLLLESGVLGADAQEDDVVKNIWQKGTSEFWNGYAGQKAIVLDDAFQQRPDVADKDNEYINVIKMVSSWAMPLNFADLASKGKIYFNSPLIVGTTNVENLRTPGETVLFCPGAVVRRIAAPYVIKLRQEFANADGRLDMVKYAAEVDKSAGKPGIDGFPFHMWECHAHDYMSGVTSVRSYPLTHVLRTSAERLKSRLCNQDKAQSVLKGFIAGMRKPVAVEEKVELSGPDADCPEEIKAMAGGNVSVRAGEEPIFYPPPYTPTLSEADRADLLARDEAEFEAERTSFFSWFQRAGVHLKNNLLKYAAVGLLLATVKGLVSYVLDFISPEDKQRRDEFFAESNRPMSAGVSQDKPKTRYVSPIKPQGGLDPVVAKVYNNSMKVTVLNGERMHVLGQAIFVSSDMAIVPHHFRGHLLTHTLAGCDKPLEAKVIFTHALSNEMVLEMSVERFLALKSHSVRERDLEFLSVSLLNAPKNIIKNFVTEADVRYLSGKQCRLDVMEVDDRVTQLARPRHAIHLSRVELQGVLRYEGYALDRCAAYTSATSPGDCGAPVSLENAPTFGGRRTFGVHVAGRESYSQGFATIVTQEMIQHAMRQLGTVYDDSEEDISAQCGGKVRNCDAMPDGFGGSLLPVYEVDRAHELPMRSKMFRNELYGVFGEHRYYPAVMRPVERDGVLVKPMLNAVKPYSSPLMALDKDLLEQSLHVAMKPHARATQHCPRMIFTYEEAVLGIQEMRWRSLPRNTSAGFPYMYDVRGGKTFFFGDDEKAYDLDREASQQLKRDVLHVIAEARKGVRLGHVFVDLLKDELRKESKIESVATRLISSSPVRYGISFRMFFGAFCAATMEHHTTTGMAPGINCYQDWPKLGAALESKGPKVFAGDLKGLDSSEQPDLHLLILDYINRWYDDGAENALVRRVLWMDLYHSRHLGGDGTDQRFIYQWNKSLPSGHPITTIVNSMYTLTTLVACYITETKDLVGFWDNVFAVVYGDDNVLNPRDEVVPRFNQIVVAKHMWALFGMIYTSDDKEAELAEYTDLSGVSFLKRRFRVEPGGDWEAPLDLDSFLFSCYWSKNKKLKEKIIVDELENALCELSLHPSSMWDCWFPKIQQALVPYQGAHNTECAPTRSAYRKRVKARADAWF